MKINKYLMPKERVLFSSEAGNNSNSLQLEDNINNYKRYKVRFKVGNTTGPENSAEAKVGNVCQLSVNERGYFDNYYGVRIHAGRCSITGSTLTRDVIYTITISTEGAISFSDSIKEIYITEIIGYN